MAFEKKIESEKISPLDFQSYPSSCECGGDTNIAIATVANKNTGAMLSGAASKFCGRNANNNPDWKLQDWYSLISYRGYCIPCWEKASVSGHRTYSDTETREAWLWFIGKLSAGSDSMGGVFKQKPATIEQEDNYLLIVNREARRTGIPDAIPDEYKIAEVWGVAA